MCSRRLTCGHEDGVGLLVSSMHNVASLGHTLLGGARQVGDPLAGEGQDGGPGVALLVDALGILYCYLHHTITHCNQVPHKIKAGTMDLTWQSEDQGDAQEMMSTCKANLAGI